MNRPNPSRFINESKINEGPFGKPNGLFSLEVQRFRGSRFRVQGFRVDRFRGPEFSPSAGQKNGQFNRERNSEKANIESSSGGL